MRRWVWWVSLLAAGCLDFRAALSRCEADPSLCVSDAAVSGGATGEALASGNACADQVDNDGDGLVDCADPECLGRVCRGAVGECDVAELCAGAAECPPDSVASPQQECRAAAAGCDAPERCDGASKRCPADQSTCGAGAFCDDTTDAGECASVRRNGAACRRGLECLTGNCVDGVCCDSPCDGGCGTCAAAGALGTCTARDAGTVCRPVGGLCDVEEVCAGGLACPQDRFVDAGVSCRPDAGPCDVAEVCGGAAAACPVDQFLPSTVLCRPAAGPCDRADRCDGLSAPCVDGFVDAGVVCRDGGLSGVCDAPETCTGDAVACPADQNADAGAPCGPPSCANGQRSDAPTCDDRGVCTPPAPSSCGGFACNGAACLTVCTNDLSCVGGFRCDGGACVPLPGLGTACTNPSQCANGNCFDGVCCDRPCTGGCEFCDSSGVCTPRTAGTDPEGACGVYTCNGLATPQTGCRSACAGGACSSDCKAGFFCAADGGCLPKKATGANTCASSCECASGNCNDGFCCGTACGGPCENCGTSPGSCSNVALRTDPESGCGLTLCDGAGRCLAACGAAGCSSNCKAGSFCGQGAACTAQALAGQACQPVGCSCAGGLACTTYYVDGDGDGFGSSTVAGYFCGTGASGSNRALSNTDCCDTDIAARPTQAGYSSLPNRCGSYDYNCDGFSTPEYGDTAAVCTTGGSCTEAYCDGAGVRYWTGSSVPACGASGSTKLCSVQAEINPCTGGFRCLPSTVTSTTTQRCH